MTAHLADVLPAAAAALGAPVPWLPGDGAPLVLPPARHVVVVLVDGLGEHLLRERSGHAPFLRRLRARPASTVLDVAYPTTTAASMGSLGTGLPPGTHGIVGLEVRDPERDVVFSTLGWDPDVDPVRFQPRTTVFEHLARAGRSAAHVGPRYFDGSGLTTAALRGARFVAAESLPDRVDATLAALRAAGPDGGLVYLYWGEVDKTGHVHGVDSFQWGEQVEAVDAELGRLARSLPPGTLLLVTADHGMVDVPFERRVDLATEPELRAGVRLLAGEPRAVQLHVVDGALDDVLAAWRARFAADFSVLSRAECLEAGWFGDVDPAVLPRIGDVVLSATSDAAVVDSRTARREVLALRGLHGALTERETRVPLLVTTAEEVR